MKRMHEISKTLAELKPELRSKYKVKEIGIFGSYKRDQQKATSDIDILVDFEETPTLPRFINLEHYLSDTLDVKVDLVMKKALKPHIGKTILEEVSYI